MAEKRFFHLTPTGKLKRVRELTELLSCLKDGGYIWIDLQDPKKEDLEVLVQPLGIHPLSVEDCLDDDQVPKIEDFTYNTFILFNCYSYLDRKILIEEVDFMIGDNFLVTVHGHGGHNADFFGKLEDTINQDLENVRKGPDFLLHVILDYTVDKKFSAIEALQEEIDAAEELVIKSPSTFRPERLIYLRRDLLALRKSLFHEREILVKICRRDSPFIGEKAIYHFRDIYDHLAKFFEAIEIYREMITSMMEMYLSVINNQMSKAANRTNGAVRRLTVVNTIFMPLTLLAGIGGMSEWTMVTGAENWKLAYPLFFGLLGVVAVASYSLLKWFDARTRSPRKSVQGVD